MYDAIIYKATYGRTLTLKWPPVPHPWSIPSFFRGKIITFAVDADSPATKFT